MQALAYGHTPVRVWTWRGFIVTAAVLLHTWQGAQACGLVLQEKPPFEIPVEASRQEGSIFAGYVSMTVLPQHVSTAAKLERLAWVLLTLQAQLHNSIKDFKVRFLAAAAHLVCFCQ